MKFIRLLSVVWALMIGAAWAADSVPTGQNFHDNARGPTPIMEMTKPPVLGNAINDDVRRTRNYTWQPPTIPHRVDGDEVDKNFNKCMDCHSRAKAEVSQAVPVSVSHYMTRDGHMLGQVSTRRYFCMQCHVAQENARPIVENKFQDVDTLIQKSQRAPAGNNSKR